MSIRHPKGTDPVTLVEAALTLAAEQTARAKQSVKIKPHDEVWVVFDLEQTHDERRKLAVQARAMVGAAALHFAVSDPAFEYWLLLHAEYTTAAFKDGRAVIRRLQQHWPDYAKNRTPSADFLKLLPDAVSRARQRRKSQFDLAQPEHPFTDVDRLVCALNAATRAHLRFPIPST